jgi:hypothetical protein
LADDVRIIGLVSYRLSVFVDRCAEVLAAEVRIAPSHVRRGETRAAPDGKRAEQEKHGSACTSTDAHSVVR